METLWMVTNIDSNTEEQERFVLEKKPQVRAPEWRPDGRRREVKGYAAFSMSSVMSKSCCEQLLMRPSSVSSISSRLSRSAWNSCWFFHRKLEMQQLPLEDKRQQSRFAAEAPKKLTTVLRVKVTDGEYEKN